MKKLPKNSMSAALLMSVLALSACGGGEDRGVGGTTSEGKSEAVTIASTFYLEPFATGCEKFDALDATALLATDPTPVLTMGSEALAMACEFRTTPEGEPGPRVRLELESAGEAWGATVLARELTPTEPWTYAFLDHYSESDSNYDTTSGQVVMSVTDSSETFRFTCRFIGEAKEDMREVEPALEAVASMEQASTSFCTEALALALVSTDE